MALNIADLFEHAVDAAPDKPAVKVGDAVITFAELEAASNRLGHFFASRGIAPGDHVGIYAKNSIDHVVALMAILKVRAVAINVNYRYVENELNYLFDNADLVALVHGREFVSRIAAVKDQCPKIKVLVSIEDGTDEDLATIGSMEYEAALSGASDKRYDQPRSPDDQYVLYTGGTTGMPKGVMWRQEDFFHSTIGALMGGGNTFESPEDVMELARNGGTLVGFPIAPLMHGAAQWVALMLLLQGNTLVLSDQKKMVPHDVWATVVRENVMTISLVGDAMARPLIEALEDEGAEYDLSNFYVIGSGGAILSPTVKQKINEVLPNVLIVDSLGASETGFQGSVAGADAEGKPRFVMGAHTVVIDEAGVPIERGSGIIGLLARKGYMPLGYYKDEAKTASTFMVLNGERWVVPGDMARVEADGQITLLGRGSVSINSGGEKIFPEEVELALKSHPDVFDVVVVGVPDERWGERVAAVVKARGDAKPTAEDLAAHARTTIAGYKVPKEVHLVDEIVRSPSGKADYRWAKAIATETA